MQEQSKSQSYYTANPSQMIAVSMIPGSFLYPFYKNAHYKSNILEGSSYILQYFGAMGEKD